MRYLVIFILGVLVLSGCRSQRDISRSGDIVRSGDIFERGEASWYGPGFHGNATANGERYNQDAMTAAHRTLPFDTVVRVRNLRNNKYVDVRINDRGPYARGRVIDLSRAAARQIDMINSGVAPVEIIILSGATPVSRTATASEEFTVQVASYNTRREAEAATSGIRGARVHEARADGRTVYRVYVGSYNSRRDAERRMNRLRRDGVRGFVKQVQN